MDVERMESHVAKWLSDNCVDTNATVLQNIRLFQDHASNVYKDKVAMYETRDDMERLPPDAANPNAFSETGDSSVQRATMMLIQTGKLLAAILGPDVLSYLPGKVAPCGLTARRHHGTKTGPDNGHTIGGAVVSTESCRGMFATVAGVVHQSAFWQAHEQFPQRPEFCDFKPSTGGNSAPVPYTVQN